MRPNKRSSVKALDKLMKQNLKNVPITQNFRLKHGNFIGSYARLIEMLKIIYYKSLLPKGKGLIKAMI